MQSYAEGRPRRPLRRRHLVGAILVVVATSVVVWIIVKDHPAETAVKDFFDALRADDTAAALALVDTSMTPDSEGAVFLSPEAIDMPWETPETEIVEHVGREATVAAIVETGAGTERVEYAVESVNGDWLLDSPFVSVTFDWQPIDYGQVNGVVVPLESQVVSGHSNPGLTFDLFPGEYEFYQSVPEVVEIESDGPETLLAPTRETQTLLGPSKAGGPIDIEGPAELTFAPEAVAEVQQAVDAQMAECLAATERKPDNCPFWFQEPFVNADGEQLSSASDLEWSIDEPLTITLGAHEAGSFSFPVVSELAGQPIALTGTGTNRDEGFTPETFTTRCGIDFSHWLVTLTSDGERIGIELDVRGPSNPNTSTCDTEL